MSPKVIVSKLEILQKILSDLKPYIEATREVREEAHYEIERQVQLIVDTALAIGRRWLVLKGLPASETGREVFIELAKKKVISRALSRQLAQAVGLRNLIVHEYAGLDYDIFFAGLKDGYKTFVKFAAAIEKDL